MTLRGVIDLINRSVWSSQVRISASRQFRYAAEHGVLLPPDVVAVAMSLLDEQRQLYGDLVNQRLLPLDEELTEAYKRNLPRGGVELAHGTTLLTPFRDHLDALLAADVVRDTWVWHDMPRELYLINRTDLDPATRQRLLDLGYGELLSVAASGGQVYKADDAAILAAVEKQEQLAYKALPVVTAGVVKLLGLVVGGAAAIYVCTRVAEAFVYRWRHEQEWENEKRKLDNVADANRIQLVKAEAAAELVKHCMAGVTEGRTTQRDCQVLMNGLLEIAPERNPPDVRLSCGFSGCWPWAMLGLGLGSVGGGLFAKRRGWI